MQKESGKEQLGGAEVRVCVEGGGGGVKITQTGRTLERTQQGRKGKKGGKKGIAQCRKKDGQDKQQQKGDGERAGRT